MCGIAGFLNDGHRPWPSDGEDILRAMASAIRHRGPDDEGVFSDAGAGIGLAHRRLSILDLSPAGHQPMISHCGRLVLVYNGEIYNFQEIREELERTGSAPRWRGTSDTEVMLAAFGTWGIDAALRRFNGMFALALWDREARTLTLARDRIGEKPLYYGVANGTLLFGSEIKALKRHPAWNFEIDREALALYARYSYVPSPFSIFRGLRKLPAATHVALTADSVRTDTAAPVAYWRASDAVGQERRSATPLGADDPELLDEFDRLLRDSIRLRMISDVPLGAFLSGGYDSSLVVALMQQLSAKPVRTYTIGFDAATHNEAIFAKDVARHLGTEHTEHYVGAAEALAQVPSLTAIYDEPFADSSQIPTLLVSRLARQSVTVALTGDGGDEVFGGYNRYFQMSRWWPWIERTPHLLRQLLAVGISLPPAFVMDAAGEAGFHKRAGGALSDSWQKRAKVISARSVDDAYRALTSIVPDPSELVLGAHEPKTLATDGHASTIAADPVERMMYLDTISYLPDDILVKVDRATMSASLEGRIPYLDHRVIEFAWRLPLELKIKNGQGKLLLRRLLDRFVPRALVERPKTGFGVPLHDWLRGPLRAWADELLSSDAIRQEGFFDAVHVTRLWQEHRSGRRNHQHQLWNVLMFRSWLRQQSA